MTLERRNPVPPGVYWQDFWRPPVGGASIEGFEKWLRDNAATVKLRQSVFHGAGPDPLKAFVEGAWTLSPVLAAAANLAPDTGQERLWALFEVLKPTPWDSKQFGFPTIAPKGTATQEEDTVQKPPPEKDPLDQVDDALKGVGSAVKVAAGVAAALGLVWVVRTFRGL